MPGERKKIDSKMKYGSLVMRSYDIDGNQINAFFDSSEKLIFVLDNTINPQKTNVLLVINPVADKKWDEILSGDYGVDLETIRPKQDNKYQKLDIEYSGLPVYEDLINAFDTGDSLKDVLKQLNVLRDSAVRHSAMMRMNAANEIITKTNATIVKTKESIVRIQARLKTLRAKLTEAKKGIGRVPTKQSAAKILKLESQIDALTEKLKRAKERLKSAERRLEIATVDAELAADLLNQPIKEDETDINKNDSLIVAPKHDVIKAESRASLPKVVEPVMDDDDKQNEQEKEFTNMAYEDEEIVDKDDEVVDEENVNDEDEEKQSDVQPLFDQDPKILNEDIAFKPISFDVPEDTAESEEKTTDDDIVPVLDRDMITDQETEEIVDKDEPTEEPEEEITEEVVEEEEKPVLESMTPITDTPEYKMVVPESFSEDSLDLSEEQNMVKQEPFVPEPITQYARQPEPVVSPDAGVLDKGNENIMPEPVAPIRPMSPATGSVPVVPPVQSFGASGMSGMQTKRSKPSLVYYLLLIILIVLAVFTLWLYQRSVEIGSPELTPVAEQTESKPKTSFLKQKQAKPTVADEDVDNAPVFLDDVSVPKDSGEDISEPTQIVEEESMEPREPQIMDDVPARMMTSGTDIQSENKNISEEDVLSAKPVYEPGTKYDEMFVAEDEYVDENQNPDNLSGDQIMYEPEYHSVDMESGVVNDNAFYDEEEAAYQQEQSGLYYEE